MVEAIGAVAAAAGGETAQTARVGGAQGQTDFASWLQEQFHSVNRDVHSAERQVQRLAIGDAENVHDVILDLQKAKLSLEVLTQVRNRVLEAYQEISRMQV